LTRLTTLVGPSRDVSVVDRIAKVFRPERREKEQHVASAARAAATTSADVFSSPAPMTAVVAAHDDARAAPEGERPAGDPPLERDIVEEAVRRMPRLEHLRRERREDPESRANEGYRLLDALRDKTGGMLLLTATPMQLHDYELYSMIELVEPGLFNGYSDFASSRGEIAAINRAVTALRAERPLHDALQGALALLHEYSAPTEVLDAVSGTRADRAAAAKWLSRCHRLSTALVRNRKSEIGGFKKRVAHRIEVVPTDAELRLQSDLLDYIRGRYFAADPKKRTAVGLVLVTFQKMLCSSSSALAGALESRAARLRDDEQEPGSSDDPDVVEQERQLQALASSDVDAELDALDHLARRARRLDDAKLAALEAKVDEILAADPDEKILIFSQFHESIEMIRSRLAGRHRVAVFHGRMSRDEKDAAHDAFRRGVQVLVSSEAGGEGRNFQFAHIVVNYDLPWNPMKIEQRIGRVDRVGQTRDVEIYNFAVRGMLDERILSVLEQRIHVFTETVGALDPILESFEDELGRIALGERGDADTAFAHLDAELEDEIARAKKLEELRRDFVLDWRSFQRERAEHMRERAARATREDLEHFCRVAIGRSGTGSVTNHDDGGLLIKVPGKIREARKEVEEDYRGTFDVKTALADERMHFFAMGHPLVEGILDHTGDCWWLPISVFESAEWNNDEPALLVDYRLELYGIRDSGALISHLVTEEGVRPAVAVLEPDDPKLEVRLPALPAEQLARFADVSSSAARREALRQFEEYKAGHAALVEEELERIIRMFDSRRGFIHDRIRRNHREIERLEQSGTESQKRILPARRGQISADRARLAELDREQSERVSTVQSTLPAHFLRLLGAALVVRPGKLTELAV
jgi:hypothetical protein